MYTIVCAIILCAFEVGDAAVVDQDFKKAVFDKASCLGCSENYNFEPMPNDDLRTNPRIRAFLDVIAHAEGTDRDSASEDGGYNVLVGGSRIANADAGGHPLENPISLTIDGKRTGSTAAGRYQILSKTWHEMADRAGAEGFSPEDQDRVAIELIKRRGALDDVLSGDIESALDKLNAEWASLPNSQGEFRYGGQSGHYGPTEIVDFFEARQRAHLEDALMAERDESMPEFEPATAEASSTHVAVDADVEENPLAQVIDE